MRISISQCISVVIVVAMVKIHIIKESITACGKDRMFTKKDP